LSKSTNVPGIKAPDSVEVDWYVLGIHLGSLSQIKQAAFLRGLSRATIGGEQPEAIRTFIRGRGDGLDVIEFCARVSAPLT
jgi:hypothetical protein